MRPLTIIERLCRGARFAQLPDSFKVDISIKNDVVYVDFIDSQSNASLYYSFFFIDYDKYKSFDDFSQKGQRLHIERLSEAIVADICLFMSGEYEGEEDPDVPYHSINGCFDIDAYMDDWLEYYDLISDDEDILEEYTDPEEETDE